MPKLIVTRLFYEFSFNSLRTENEERKKQLDEVSSWIKTENDKRMKEAEALKAR